MSNNIAKVQLSDTFDYQRRRINDALDVINNLRDGVLEVATEANLPSPSSAPSNIYLIRNHTKYKGTVLALLNGNSYTMVPLKNDPINANHYIYSAQANFGPGTGVNKFVYLDSNKVWQLADCTNDAKKAIGIVGPYNSVVLSGIVQSAGLSLTPGITYYYDNTGSLTTTVTSGYAGIALDTNMLDVNIREKIQIPQSDWNQNDSSANDYIKNKPGNVSKTAAGFVPTLPNESAVTKFFRQDGTWSVPNYPDVSSKLNKTGDAMTGVLSDVNAAQVRNLTILTSEGSTGNNGWLYGVIENPDVMKNLTFTIGGDYPSRFDYITINGVVYSNFIDGVLTLSIPYGTDISWQAYVSGGGYDPDPASGTFTLTEDTSITINIWLA